MKSSGTHRNTENSRSDNPRDERPDKQPMRTLFNDLGEFRGTKVSIVTFGGEVVKGKLLSYDEVANCVLEDNQKRMAVVFGKSITMVCQGEVDSL